MKCKHFKGNPHPGLKRASPAGKSLAWARKARGWHAQALCEFQPAWIGGATAAKGQPTLDRKNIYYLYWRVLVQRALLCLKFSRAHILMFMVKH
ncbi:MAG: hypothetical protein AB7U63_14840 [Porticoccaceae bacterium]|uniref:Uncharacterized protein n=1 Tax=uncultured Desulfovibrio sp. TaxID=167968 RepID=A0A212L9J1_9BACT|nr:hypothetical protein KL86DES1_21783 [uncultured Desulfovibrio sp.]VZH34683.1 conserved protein of unknown function [Desulfovibrio sp. 86]